MLIIHQVLSAELDEELSEKRQNNHFTRKYFLIVVLKLFCCISHRSDPLARLHQSIRQFHVNVKVDLRRIVTNNIHYKYM